MAQSTKDNNNLVAPSSDKEYARYNTLHPTPYQHFIRAHGINVSNERAQNNDSDNDNEHRPGRLSGGTLQHHTGEKLHLSPRQQPAGLKFFDNNKQATVINLQLNDVRMRANVDGVMLPPGHTLAKNRTRATQTLFRESSAQTLPYLPGVSNSPEELENFEIFKLAAILPGDGPPGVYEVEVLERSRKRWAFAKALKDNFRQQLEAAKHHTKFPQHEHILQAFEWEHWIQREEYIQECQMLRLEILIRMFDKRESEMYKASKNRIQKSYEEIEAKRKAALKKNEIEYNRAVRRLQIKHTKEPRTWRKQPISQELGDYSSEFYAPKMRYGVNPNRRHFVASRKGFDMRMDDLEKKAIKMDPKNLTCPFAKLREWSKPKGVLQEVEQNFCSDANLDKLYESLRTLGEKSRKQKYTPVCIKAKEPFKQTCRAKDTYEEVSPTHALNSTRFMTEQKSYDDSISTGSMNTAERDSLEPSEFKESFENLRQQKQAERLHMLMLQQEMHCEELETLVNSYEGHTIGWLMRFLSEEMCRLKEQRKLHFFAMIAKRQRWHREAAEAGLRQKENTIRDTYETLYKEYETANQDVTDTFFNTILTTDIKECAQQKAEEEILTMAKGLDKEISGWLESFADVQNPLNYHTLRHALKDIVMPDMEKKIQRLERDDCINYIVNDVLLLKVYQNLQPYDVSFGIASDLIDRLTDNDLYLKSSDCSSQFYCCSKAQKEAEAIIRKIIRYAVPGRCWHTEGERIALENIHDLLDDVLNKVAANYDDEVASPFNLCKQTSHTDLVCLENDIVFGNTSQESTSSECFDDFYFEILHSKCKSNVMDVTKSLKCNEKFLLADPDKISADKELINKNEYTLPGPKPKLCRVHEVASTLDLSVILDFNAPATFAQTSNSELMEEIQAEEENYFEKTSVQETEYTDSVKPYDIQEDNIEIKIEEEPHDIQDDNIEIEEEAEEQIQEELIDDITKFEKHIQEDSIDSENLIDVETALEDNDTVNVGATSSHDDSVTSTNKKINIGNN